MRTNGGGRGSRAQRALHEKCTNVVWSDLGESSRRPRGRVHGQQFPPSENVDFSSLVLSSRAEEFLRGILPFSGAEV
jgi:hypothetical protein